MMRNDISGAPCRLGWFSAIKYEIGGQEYSADAIEHGILRANRPGPASLSVLLGHPEWSKGYFKKDDPRLKQVPFTFWHLGVASRRPISMFKWLAM